MNWKIAKYWKCYKKIASRTACIAFWARFKKEDLRYGVIVFYPKLKIYNKHGMILAWQLKLDKFTVLEGCTVLVECTVTNWKDLK